LPFIAFKAAAPPVVCPNGHTMPANAMLCSTCGLPFLPQAKASPLSGPDTAKAAAGLLQVVVAERIPVHQVIEFEVTDVQITASGATAGLSYDPDGPSCLHFVLPPPPRGFLAVEALEPHGVRPRYRLDIPAGCALPKVGTHIRFTGGMASPSLRVARDKDELIRRLQAWLRAESTVRGIPDGKPLEHLPDDLRAGWVLLKQLGVTDLQAPREQGMRRG
jgi:hypothetical protein